MPKGHQPLPPRGDENATLLYLLVGQALSWWEASEDQLLTLFRSLCDNREPVAVRAYIEAPRVVRTSMLKLAIDTYSHMFADGDIKKVHAALRELDKLASVRNQIAHGHVSHQTHHVGNEEVAYGNYLLPNLSEGSFFERTFRFSHTSKTISSFITDVRRWRGDIMDVAIAVMVNNQERERFGVNDMLFFQLARSIARLEVSGRDAFDRMRELVAIVDRQSEDA